MTMLVQNLVICHISLIVICNYLVQFPLDIGPFLVSWGMFSYPLIIILTDLTTRLIGSESARKVIYLAWLPAWGISMYMSQPRIACASIAAYGLSQLLDISIFSNVRQYCHHHLQKRTGLWMLPPLISAVFSQAVDTYFFYAAAFYASSDEFLAAHWLEIATSDYAFKCLMAVLLLLPIYGLMLRYLLGKMQTPSSNFAKLSLI